MKDPSVIIESKILVFTWRKTDNVTTKSWAIWAYSWTSMNIHEHTRQKTWSTACQKFVIEFSFNAWMTHSAAIIFNTTIESDEPCHDSQNITNMVSQLISVTHPNPTQNLNLVSNRVSHRGSNRGSNRVKIVFKVSKYTNIFGMVQMLEAFCLAPFVGAVIDFSGPVSLGFIGLSANSSMFHSNKRNVRANIFTKYKNFENFKIFAKFLKNF